MKLHIPKEAAQTALSLEAAGFEAYFVGGCVRDLIRGARPKDWDIATNALPEEILEIFDHSHYDNEYGTVRVVLDGVSDKTLNVLEITTYRLEAEYSDGRRPDTVTFSKNIEDDLKRRDFTINALALRLHHDVIHETSTDIVLDFSHETYTEKGSNFTLLDLYSGIQDLNDGIIRTVGDPIERFNEDALRMLRAVRLSAQLGFTIEQKTKEAIQSSHSKLENIAVERIKDEFEKLIMSEQPKYGIETAHSLNVLAYISPELEKTIGMEQNQAHSHTLWDHLLRSLQATADKGWELEIRLAALFHDIAKVDTRRWDKKKKDWSFHGHEVIGSRVTKKILERLRFPRKTTEKTVKLVRWHMFFSDTDQITLTAVRRMISNVGQEYIWDLMNLRVADRIGTGTPKEEPYRLRKYHSMIEEALRSPVSVAQLKIRGDHIMKEAQEAPGPKIGHVLHALLEEVLIEPSKNTEEFLMKRAKELLLLPEEELRSLGESGREKKEKEDEKVVQSIRKKHWVK